MATMAKRVGIIAAVASIVAACGFQAKADPLVVPQPPVTTVVDPPPYTGVDSSTPVDAVGSASDVNTVTPHVIAGLTGANLLDNSLVVTGAFSEGDPHLHRTFWVDFAGSVVQQLRRWSRYDSGTHPRHADLSGGECRCDEHYPQCWRPIHFDHGCFRYW
jgi:hypothetical protein